jgi:hypothetical protein
VVSRWHWVLSKYFFSARKLKLAAAQGTFDTSIAARITPWFVVIVIVSMPDFGMPVVGGRPTSFDWPSVLFQAQSALAVGSALSGSKTPAYHSVPSTISTRAIAVAVPAWICRRLRAAAARRAIWRSSFARASARWRSLVRATVRILLQLSDLDVSAPDTPERVYGPNPTGVWATCLGLATERPTYTLVTL